MGGRGAGPPELVSFDATHMSYYFTLKYMGSLFYLRVDTRRPEYEVWKVVPKSRADPEKARKLFEALVGGNPLTLRVSYMGQTATLVDIMKLAKKEPAAEQPHETNPQGQESFPVHQIIRQIRGKTIYRSKRFWRAVVLTEDPAGRRSVRVYLWRSKDGGWRTIQKLKINTKKGWEKLRQAIDELVKELDR